jgi:putative SOS response-associated peptidase YedK
MCNNYSMTKSQQAIRELTRAMKDTAGNLPSLPCIFPDNMAPVVIADREGERELTMMRWGMPGPPQFGGAPVTNIRNTTSPHWRRWLGSDNRCLVPVTSFCEEDTKPRKPPLGLPRTRPGRSFFRRHLDILAGCARDQGKPGGGAAPALWLPDYRRE